MYAVTTPDALRQVRNSVAAVGYLSVPLTEYATDPTRPFFKAVGSGFLVRPTTVATNRHVIDELLRRQADLGFPDDQRRLLFVYPGPSNTWLTSFCRIQRFSAIDSPELDVGFCDFRRRPEKDFEQVMPPDIRTDEKLLIGDPVAVCGYPYGDAMLHRDGKVYRWGPVVQRGYISALSPYDTAQEPALPGGPRAEHPISS